MWRKALKKEPGWLAVAMSAAELRFAAGRFAPEGKSVISQCGVRSMEQGPQSAERLARELHFDRHECLTVLEPSAYQLLLVDAPTVPQAELRSAIRWRIKDMLDYHVDDATIDVLDIPPEGGPSAAARNHSMYAVAARNDAVKGVIKSFEEARIPLSVIDIPETAQRNIATLFETAGQGIALLHFEHDYGLLTINHRAELYLARRIELGLSQLTGATGEAREALFNRVVLELQRTFDHFERQYRTISVSRLLLGPEPQETGLLDHVKANLGVPVERADLDRALTFGSGEVSPADRWRLFHVIGASLRHETKAL